MSDQQCASLQQLQLVGVVANDTRYDVCGSQLVASHDQAKLRTNGNPPDMLGVTRSLFDDSGQRVLFVVERDTNRNVIMYMHSREQLVAPRWLMIPRPPVHYDGHALSDDAEIELGDVHTEELTPLEATLGYGARTDLTTSTLFLQALMEEPIQIRMVDNVAHAFITIVPNAPPLILRRIFIGTEPRPMAWPRVVELYVEVQQDANGDGAPITYLYRV